MGRAATPWQPGVTLACVCVMLASTAPSVTLASTWAVGVRKKHSAWSPWPSAAVDVRKASECGDHKRLWPALCWRSRKRRGCQCARSPPFMSVPLMSLAAWISSCHVLGGPIPAFANTSRR